MTDPKQQRTPLWLRPLRAIERARGWKRRLLVLAALGVIVAAAALVVRYESLGDLPDVGDPFDVKAFVESCRVPDERNAFLLYRQAIAALVSLDRADAEALQRINAPDHASASPELRDWLASNGEALALWLDGTHRPDALAAPVDRPDTRPVSENEALRQLAKLAHLEATRRMQSGDMAGAWPYLRGIVRFGRHLTRHASSERLQTGMRIEQRVTTPLMFWVGDERTSTELLRQALNDLIAADTLAGTSGESLKIGYLSTLHDLLNRPETKQEALDFERGHHPHPLLFLPGGSDVFWFAKNEPTRSLRLARLVLANWLSQCDKPPASRAPLAPQPYELELYDLTFDRSASVAAKLLSPEALNAWFESSVAARQTLPPAWSYLYWYDRWRETRLGLGNAIAVELQWRESGMPPDNPR